MTQEGSPTSNDWQKPALWIIFGLAALLFLASFTGNGTGMFGWGFAMGLMWIWMLVPFLLVVLLVVFVVRLQERQPQ